MVSAPIFNSKTIIFLIIGRILRVCPCNNEENGDKFILDPVQLIDLVNEELNNKKGDIPVAAVLSHYKTANVLFTKDTAETSTGTTYVENIHENPRSDDKNLHVYFLLITLFQTNII